MTSKKTIELEQNEERVRMKAEMQVGDGIDARGTITTDIERICTLVEDDEGVLRAGPEHERLRADWVLDAKAQMRLAREELGLEDDE